MRDDEDIKLRPKSFEMLHYLLERPGQLVSKAELLDFIWSPTVVTDDVVTQSLIDIRRAIGDDARTMIRTVPRRGYLLELPVETEEVPCGSSASTSAFELSKAPVRAALALILVIGLSFAWFGYVEREVTQPGNAAPIIQQQPYSIAVLPFVDLSPQEDLGYFADGISEELRNLLAGFSDLRVIARTSTLPFRGESADIDAVRTRLNVTHVLEGSVRQSGDTIRITAQLVDANNSQHVWSQTYDRTLDDVFAVQEEISAEVLQRLTSTLFETVSTRPQPDPEAYRLYLQAVHLINQEDWRKADQAEVLLTDALEIDPKFASAWRELGRIRWRRIGQGLDHEQDIAHTLDALERALALEPGDAGTLAYHAWHLADFDGDIEGGARLLERALKLDAGNEHVIRPAIIFATALGRPEDAVKLGEYGIANNPLCQQCYMQLASAYANAGRFEDMEQTLRTTKSLFNQRPGYFALSMLFNNKPEQAMELYAQEERELHRLFGSTVALYDLGRIEESDRLLARYLDLVGDQPAWEVAFVNAWTGRFDAAFAAIRKAAEADRLRVDGRLVRWNLQNISRNMRHPMLHRLRDDPRWHELSVEYGVSPERIAAAQFNPLFSLPTEGERAIAER